MGVDSSSCTGLPTLPLADEAQPERRGAPDPQPNQVTEPKQTASGLLSVPPRVRSGIQMLVDALAWVVAIILAQLLRFDFSVSQISWAPTAMLIAIAIVVQLACGSIFRLYQRRYGYGTFEEARAVTFAAVVMAVVVGIPVFAFSWPSEVPRSTVLLAFPIAVLGMLCFRYVLRLWAEASKHNESAEPAIIFGAGDVGASIVQRMLTDTASPYVPAALLDDDPLKRHAYVRNVGVAGRLEDLPQVASETGAHVLVVAIAAADAELLQRVASLADECKMEVKIVPPLAQMLTGSNEPTELRSLTIEDIIGRRPVDTNVESIAGYLTGRRVLVTGAGGSIGQELCAQIHRFNPAELIMLDRDETGLQSVEMKVCGNGLLNTPEVVLADIRDAETIEHIFRERRPDVVFHAAALKHLPMLQQYPEEAWKTNVLGSLNVLRAAEAADVTTYVNISTDKAADPTSVLGYSKHLAEQLTAWTAQETGNRYLSVRFGNVLGSRGSMLPLFRTLIEQGKPLTITDENVERYFMTIPEACELVLQAGGIGRGGEVLILDMGKPVKILDIAKRLIGLSGKDVGIVFTGLRPGEKLTEGLISEHENAERPFHPLISHVKGDSITPSELDEHQWLSTVVSAGPRLAMR